MGKMEVVCMGNNNEENKNSGSRSEEEGLHHIVDSGCRSHPGSTGKPYEYQSQRIDREDSSRSGLHRIGFISHGGTLRYLIEDADDQIAVCDAEIQRLHLRKQRLEVRRGTHLSILQNLEKISIEELNEPLEQLADSLPETEQE